MKFVKGHRTKAVKGHGPKAHRVFPALSIPTKKPPRAKLRFVKELATGRIGCVFKWTKEYLRVFMGKREWKTFRPDEVEETELKEVKK